MTWNHSFLLYETIVTLSRLLQTDFSISLCGATMSNICSILLKGVINQLGIKNSTINVRIVHKILLQIILDQLYKRYNRGKIISTIVTSKL
jgi:hypothetical protein